MLVYLEMIPRYTSSNMTVEVIKLISQCVTIYDYVQHCEQLAMFKLNNNMPSIICRYSVAYIDFVVIKIVLLYSLSSATHCSLMCKTLFL